MQSSSSNSQAVSRRGRPRGPLHFAENEEYARSRNDWLLHPAVNCRRKLVYLSEEDIPMKRTRMYVRCGNSYSCSVCSWDAPQPVRPWATHISTTRHLANEKKEIIGMLSIYISNLFAKCKLTLLFIFN